VLEANSLPVVSLHMDEPLAGLSMLEKVIAS